MPAIQIVDTLLQEAIKQGASDIHFESQSKGLLVRFRTDGLLFDATLIPLDKALKVLARIKVLAHLDVAEKRLPQDGKFSYTHDNHELDLRVSTFPSLYGEKIVIRILKRSFELQTFDRLGFRKEAEETIQELAQKTSGFILITGPTGSGKTTTLYTLLQNIACSEKNIVTLEDPIEYTIERTTQSQVQPEIGFTFARGIRSLLRQDPDIVMVGEIRDRETAEVAIQAALTGHLVLSSLHTADAVSSLARLLDMGIPAFLINAALTGIIAQRLVRVLCTTCRYEAVLGERDKDILRYYKLAVTRAYNSSGCADCYGRGYKKRTVISELLVISPDLRALLTAQPSYDALYAQALKGGMLALRDDAAYKIQEGITSVSEVVRALC